MPLKDPEKKRAYQREWYARPANKARTVAKVIERKHTAYAGVCEHCGGPTVGQSKNDRPRFCSKPECLSVQRNGRRYRLRGQGKRVEQLFGDRTGMSPQEQREALVEYLRGKV